MILGQGGLSRLILTHRNRNLTLAKLAPERLLVLNTPVESSVNLCLPARMLQSEASCGPEMIHLVNNTLPGALI